MEEAKKTVEKGDFIEIEYKGMTKEGRVFDSTDAAVAKKNNFFNQNAEYGPAVICVGESHVLKGIDEQLEGKRLEKEYKIELQAEKAFGKKSAKLLRLVPMAVLRRQKIDPQPGLQIIMDGFLGTVRKATGGRVIVDFNHPLAGQDVVYEIKINRIVTDTKEKLDSLFKIETNLKEFKTEITEGKAEIKIKNKFPEELTEKIEEDIKRLMPDIKEVEITGEKV